MGDMDEVANVDGGRGEKLEFEDMDGVRQGGR